MRKTLFEWIAVTTTLGICICILVGSGMLVLNFFVDAWQTRTDLMQQNVTLNQRKVEALERQLELMKQIEEKKRIINFQARN